MAELKIRHAKATDSTILTDISLRAKKYWNYPDEYMERWKDELTITPEYIENNTVFVGELEDKIVGFYSLIEIHHALEIRSILIEKGTWLDHMFILPRYMGKGIGTKFTTHMKAYLSEKRVDKVLIFVDPYAKGFYEKVGAKFRRESDSSIPGRKIPVYEIKIGI
ncbi:MAG: GNAT family N-acetyltransferase [Geobacteraceae bacterium]|nr:GNAT family N-acetyltransferase [Geobacteraceae bacterium]